ncbi:MAG: hypothetical protein PHF97_08195 [Bacteroidales bacterium]|nr:hypothetical protein [Bacteroidales bacterium]
MYKEDTADKWIEQVLDSTNNKAAMEMEPSLFEKILSRTEHAPRKFIPSVIPIRKTMAIAAALALLITVNVFLISWQSNRSKLNELKSMAEYYHLTSSEITLFSSK